MPQTLPLPWKPGLPVLTLIDFTTVVPPPISASDSLIEWPPVSRPPQDLCPEPLSQAPSPSPHSLPAKLGWALLRKRLSLPGGLRTRPAGPAGPAGTSAGAGRWPWAEPRGRGRHLLALRLVGGSLPTGVGGASPPSFLCSFPCILHLCPRRLGPSQNQL